MKKNIFNSKIIGLASCLAILFAISSCNEDDLVTYDTGDFAKIATPYVQIETAVISFQAGTPDYELRFNAINGTKGLTEVRLYSTFTDAASGLDSDNEVLMKTYTITEPKIERISETITYDVLKAGLTVDGAPLPASELDLAIGSGWSIRFEGTYGDGTTGNLPGSINVGVLHRFAGLYKVLSSAYYRINEDGGTWNGSLRFIGSVDGDTFAYNNFWGPFSWSGNSFNFDVDYDNGNAITVPILTSSGKFSGTYTINCTDNADLFVDVPCTGSNVVTANDVTGKHVIRLTYGYFTEGSGSRQFYERLEKIVN
jgi:hypothetical protein